MSIFLEEYKTAIQNYKKIQEYKNCIKARKNLKKLYLQADKTARQSIANITGADLETLTEKWDKKNPCPISQSTDFRINYLLINLASVYIDTFRQAVHSFEGQRYIKACQNMQYQKNKINPGPLTINFN